MDIGRLHLPSSWAARLRRSAQAGLALIVCLSALALGGAHVQVVRIAATALVAAGAVALAASGVGRVPGPAMIFAGLALYSLLQSISLPLGMLVTLSPHAADLWSRALHPLGQSVARGSLSLDPGASTLEAAKWSSYSVAFWMAAVLGRRRGAAPLIWVVTVSAVAVAFTTVAHAVVGATRVFGIYEAKFTSPGWRIGPFLNANCLAGYLVLGTLCALGLIASRIKTAWRLGLVGGVALMASLVAVSGSRGAFGMLVVAVIAFGIAAVRNQRAHHRHLTWPEGAALAAGLTLVPVVAVLLVPDAWELLTQNDTEKLRMVRWVAPLIQDFKWFGVGRGAFESAFPAYRPAGFDMLYTHPENILVQWVSEWGVVVASVALAALLWLLRPSRLALRHHIAAFGAVVGVVALAAQNFVDLGLELFAPMLAVSVVLGGCWGQVRPADAPTAARTRARVLAAGGVLALSALSVALAWARSGNPDAFERLALQSKYQQLSNTNDPAQLDRLFSDMTGAMLRHPGDPYFPRLGALLAVRADKDALPWIARALERCPVDSRTHWILSNVLRSRNLMSQALLEARLTAEYEPGLAPTVGRTVAGWSQRREDIERAAPPGTVGGTVLYYAAVALPAPPFASLREELFRAAIRHDPKLPLLRMALANTLMSALNEARCEGDARKKECIADVLEQATALEALLPNAVDGSEVRARLFGATHQAQEAERTLNERCPKIDEEHRSRCWFALLSALGRQPENRAAIERAARQMVAAACNLDADCDVALLRAGDASAELGDWLGALNYFERAVSRAPTVPALLRVADAAGALGRTAIVERALTMAAGHARENPEILQQVEAKRRLMHLR